MSSQTREVLLKRLEGLDQMPTIPVVLGPLLRYLEQPVDTLDIQQVVELISRDKSLVAQCLHMANSPLFGRMKPVDSVRGAVMALGMQRMRDIALSCSVLKLTPTGTTPLDPIIFWEHSMGCALLSQRFATRIRFKDPDKVYLAGLLHDIGIIVNMWILPKEFQQAVDMAREQRMPLHEAEMATMGLDHCLSGRILAERWELSSDLITVISRHHDIQSAQSDRGLLSLVALSDLLCRMGGLGHGAAEQRQVDFQQEPAFAILLEECPDLANFDWARFTFELEGYMEEVHELVSSLYRPK